MLFFVKTFQGVLTLHAGQETPSTPLKFHILTHAELPELVNES
jgi:hypothetical protein